MPSPMACRESRFAKSFSSILLMDGSKLIGRYAPGSDGGFLGLCIATTRACFHIARKYSSRSALLYSSVRYLTAGEGRCRRRMFVTPSIPGPVRGWSFCKSRWTADEWTRRISLSSQVLRFQNLSTMRSTALACEEPTCGAVNWWFSSNCEARRSALKAVEYIRVPWCVKGGISTRRFLKWRTTRRSGVWRGWSVLRNVTHFMLW
jgi:hypothetical protein